MVNAHQLFHRVCKRVNSSISLQDVQDVQDVGSHNPNSVRWCEGSKVVVGRIYEENQRQSSLFSAS